MMIREKKKSKAETRTGGSWSHQPGFCCFQPEGEERSSWEGLGLLPTTPPALGHCLPEAGAGSPFSGWDIGEGDDVISEVTWL